MFKLRILNPGFSDAVPGGAADVLHGARSRPVQPARTQQDIRLVTVVNFCLSTR